MTFVTLTEIVTRYRDCHYVQCVSEDGHWTEPAVIESLQVWNFGVAFFVVWSSYYFFAENYPSEVLQIRWKSVSLVFSLVSWKLYLLLRGFSLKAKNYELSLADTDFTNLCQHQRKDNLLHSCVWQKSTLRKWTFTVFVHYL